MKFYRIVCDFSKKVSGYSPCYIGLESSLRELLKKVWPLSEKRSNPLKTLNQQLDQLGVIRKNNHAIEIEKTSHSSYQIVTEDDKIEVDGIIINTLEYSAKTLMTTSLQEDLTISDFSREHQWFHTSVEGILAVGDVITPRQQLPKQAILAAYDGFLAGILAVQKIKKTEDYFSINSN